MGKTPYMVVGSQDDLYQLKYNLGRLPFFMTSGERAYAEDFARRTANFMKALQSDGHVHRATFSWACFNHALSTTPLGSIASPVLALPCMKPWINFWVSLTILRRNCSGLITALANDVTQTAVFLERFW